MFTLSPKPYWHTVTFFEIPYDWPIGGLLRLHQLSEQFLDDLQQLISRH
jgi:hypothetical protein